MNIFEIIWRYREGFASGLAVTFKLAAITWCTGLGLGTAIGILAHRSPRSIGIPLRLSAFFASGTPFLVLLYWAHFPLQELLSVVIDPFITAAVVLSFLNVVIIAEIVRGALHDFRQEFTVAAQVCGMTRLETLRYVQLPLITREVIPMLLAVQVLMLQSTLFASLISVEEIFRVVQRINSAIYKPVELYSALGLFFIVLCVPLYALAFWLRRRFTRDISER